MFTVHEYLQQIKLPHPQSHKGQNGKLLIIGGSHLFHAASKWSLDVASKFVDMVFYASVPSNNELMQAAKGEFWNGMVIERRELESYLEEADVVLIGPGMERQDSTTHDFDTPPTDEQWDRDTYKIVNYLLKKYPDKKWVIDAGALQMVEPDLLNKNVIISPHTQELHRVLGKMEEKSDQKMGEPELLRRLLDKGVTVILKGPKDFIYNGEELVEVTGGNAGMTKGGTGDVLAGLVAALYAKHDVLTAAVVGSYINKRAGEELYTTVGPYFNASDLVEIVPKMMWAELVKVREQ